MRALLDSNEAVRPVPEVLVLRRGVWRSLTLAAVLIGFWSQLAPLSGAIVATGWVKSELNRKTVQHQEGGIVSRILVRDGQRVQAGEVLAIIGDVRSDAGLDLLQDQRAAEMLRRARLEAEVAFAPSFEVPATLKGSRVLKDLLPRERKVFAARRASLEEQLAALRAQSQAAAEQVQALRGQLVSTQDANKLAAEELSLNESLAKEGYVQRARVIGLQRVVAEYDARLGQQRGDQAEAQQRIEDLRLRMAQARNTYQQQAADELKDSALRLRELDERIRPSTDLADRQAVRAPVAGTVMGVRIASVGAAVGPREPLMEIVPQDERLIVEARIRPEDIEHVHAGGDGEVRLSAFEFRISPHLPAKVVFVSPDRLTDAQTGAAWYVAHLQVDERVLAEHHEVRLQTGMPAEVFVATPARSLWRYLLEPIDAFRQRALREP